MSYIPDTIVEYYAKKTEMPLGEAHTLFDELEAFLASAAAEVQRPTKRVDEAWHAFILHTQAYASYCAERFGRFIHHVPDSPDFGDFQDEELASHSKCSNCSANCRSR